MKNVTPEKFGNFMISEKLPPLKTHLDPTAPQNPPEICINLLDLLGEKVHPLPYVVLAQISTD